MSNKTKHSKKIISSGWIISIVIILLIVIPAYAFYYFQVKFIKKGLEENSMLTMQFLEDKMAQHASTTLQDITFLADKTPISGFNTLDTVQLQIIEQRLYDFGTQRKVYQKAVLLDTLGIEKVSVDFSGKSSGYKNLSERSYFIKARALKNKDIYIGNIELIREEEIVEKPLRPYIPFIRKIYAPNSGKLVGYLLLKFNPQPFFNYLQELTVPDTNLFFLSSKSGYWIQGPNPTENFSEALHASVGYGPKFIAPEQWQLLLKNPKYCTYQWDNGLSLAYKVDFAKSISTPKDVNLLHAPTWYAIGYVAESYLQNLTHHLALRYFTYTALLILLIVPGFNWLLNQLNSKNLELGKFGEQMRQKNEALEASKALIQQRLNELNKVSAEREDVLQKLKKQEGDLTRARKLANLGYYENDILNAHSTWSDDLPEIYGLPKNYDFNNHRTKEIIHPADVKDVVDAWEKAIRHQSEFKLIYRIINKHGQIEYLQEIATPEIKDGITVKMIGSVQNITERMKVEKDLLEAKVKAESATRAKSDFLATMSHEIRTPLNAVLGMARLLRTTTLDERQRDFVQTIQVSGESLLSVINDILDFSKIESGRLELEREFFDLNKILEDSMQVVAVGAASKNLHLYYTYPSEMPRLVRGDSSRLKQSLINLLNNSIKFTEEGLVCARVIVHNKDEDEVDFSIEVEDTGIGIAKEKQEGIFSAFEQADSSVTRKFGGSGLGLAITKRLVVAMNGNISLVSEPGKGSVFSLHFNFNYQPEAFITQPGINKVLVLGADHEEKTSAIEYLKAHQVEVVESKTYVENMADHVIVFTDPGDLNSYNTEIEKIKSGEQAYIITGFKHNLGKSNTHKIISRPLKQSWLLNTFVKPTSNEDTELQQSRSMNTNLRILMAEDNLVNQKLANLLFENLGFSLDMASDGKKAVEAGLEKKYDLIFMDIQMPEMSGEEATAALQKELGKGCPPIVALTANAMEGDRERYLKAGMNEYISKPINVDELKQILIKYS